jgi:HK97 gp10 family phage protein
VIDFEAIGKQILARAEASLGQGAKLVMRRAKQKAPVRNIFGEEYDFRYKTGRELQRDYALLPSVSLRVMAASGPGEFVYRRIGGQRANWRQRRRAVAEGLLEAYTEGDDTLSRRGAYEVRSGRANFSTWGHLHVGGRLRGEIFATSPSSTGSVTEAWVISPTPYAKYQELGTRHNRAHPFLRPAADESRAEVVSQIANAVRQASKAGAGQMDIEIVVRL